MMINTTDSIEAFLHLRMINHASLKLKRIKIFSNFFVICTGYRYPLHANTVETVIKHVIVMDALHKNKE